MIQEPGPDELFVADAVGQPDQVGHDVPQEIVELVVRGGGHDAEEAGVGVVEVERGDGRGEAVVGHLLAHGRGDILPQAGGGGEGAEDGLHESEGGGIGVRPGHALEGKGHRGSVVGVISDSR